MLGPRHILLVPSFLQLVSRCRRTSRCIALVHDLSALKLKAKRNGLASQSMSSQSHKMRDCSKTRKAEPFLLELLLDNVEQQHD